MANFRKRWFSKTCYASRLSICDLNEEALMKNYLFLTVVNEAMYSFCCKVLSSDSTFGYSKRNIEISVFFPALGTHRFRLGLRPHSPCFLIIGGIHHFRPSFSDVYLFILIVYISWYSSFCLLVPRHPRNYKHYQHETIISPSIKQVKSVEHGD